MKIEDNFELIPVNSNRVKIEKIGKFENEYVYDLETCEDDHMFTGNDILLHNSIYVRLDSIVHRLFGKTKINWFDKDSFGKLKTFIDTKFQDLLNNHVADFICNRFKTTERRIEFKREKISAEGEYCAKKRYVLHVRDNEGLECDKFSYTGVDVAKNELPDSIKKLLKDCVEGMIRFNWDNNTFQDKIQNIWDIYTNMPIKDIAYIKNLNTPKESTGFLEMEKGAGVHARSAEYYNQIIKELKIDNKYETIGQGDRFYYVYIKSTNKYGIDCIAWKDRYPTEFEKIFEVNKEKMFQKTIISPLDDFMEHHKFSNFDPNNVIIKGVSGCSLFDI